MFGSGKTRVETQYVNTPSEFCRLVSDTLDLMLQLWGDGVRSLIEDVHPVRVSSYHSRIMTRL